MAGLPMNPLIEAHLVLFDLLHLPLPIPPTVSIVFLVSALTSMWSVANFFEDMLRQPNPLLFNPFRTDEVFDFIVVGGGSAGSTIANRLTEDGRFKVLLLEAGGDPSLLNSIPELTPYNLHLETDWKYRTVPQDNLCLSVEEQRMKWPRGKVLGGSSTLNFMIYQRGNPNDYDNWAQLTQDDQWKYENVLPFFKKSENYHGHFPNAEFHGTTGPLYVSKETFLPSVDLWLASAKELGFETNKDMNAYQTQGFVPSDVTMKRGFRESTYHAFLKPILARRNLRIYRFAHVIKIDLDASNKATGVTYVRDGRTLTATASKEVIISAGAIGSPHLLMLSGIGPADHLESVGITPIVNLPGVGQNLQDHVLTMVGPFLLNAPVSYLADRDLTLSSALEFVKNGTGCFSSNEIAGLGFYSTQGIDPSWPNMEFHHVPIGLRTTIGNDFETTFGIKANVLEQFYLHYLEMDANFVLADLGRPSSVGEILLQNDDPFIEPLIDPKYFSDYSDMEAMIDSFKFLVKMYEETKAWQSVGAQLIPDPFPECKHEVFKSDAYYECYIRHVTMTIFHPCCTNAMGHASNPMAVVDSNLKVFGVEGLRVADASIMPKITNANLNAPSIMIGEKVSHDIVNSY